jgi:small subunit ribosomal protein S14|tara:strand:- start:3 stop:308 length:306 start_codon:yes stop_codon:yes gene_type:complete
MAKLSSVQKNLNRQKLIEKFSNKRKVLKKKIMDKTISIEERLKLQNKLNDLPRNSANIRYRNRCKLTGRTRGVYRKFGLSRIKIRELSMSGDLPGMVKSSW